MNANAGLAAGVGDSPAFRPALFAHLHRRSHEMLIHGISRMDCAPLVEPYCRFFSMDRECLNIYNLRYH
jgi:hypothetical protein